MKMKTSELTGAALSWAVDKAQGWSDIDLPVFLYKHARVNYAANWHQAGPIIERERIEIRWSDGRWIAMHWADNSGMAKKPAQRFKHNQQMAGPTPLIAAMRCYVASKLGQEVDVPDELIEGETRNED